MKEEIGNCGLECRQKGEDVEQIWGQIQPTAEQHGFSNAPGFSPCPVAPHQALLTDLHYISGYFRIRVQAEFSVLCFSYLLLHSSR